MLSGGPVFWRGWCLSRTLSPVDVAAGLALESLSNLANCWCPERDVALDRVGVNPPRPRPPPLPLDVLGRLGGALSLYAMSESSSGSASCFACATPAFSRAPEGFVLVVVCVRSASQLLSGRRIGDGGGRELRLAGGDSTVCGRLVNAVGMCGRFRTGRLVPERLERERKSKISDTYIEIFSSLLIGISE